jgi:uracil-DNA glycosylase
MTLKQLQTQIIFCRQCRRLVQWREKIAHEKVKRFADEPYWGKPVPGFGDAKAELLIIGLAPAAHGSNRTGRMFTGDRSGELLYRTLYKFGYANQPSSTVRTDGLKLINCYITALCRCAPSQNKPLHSEINNCSLYLLTELHLLKNVRVIVSLGRTSFEKTVKSFQKRYPTDLKRIPAFGHGVEYRLNNRVIVLGSYHPSQQNTFTGRLTEPMFFSIFHRAHQLLERR